MSKPASASKPAPAASPKETMKHDNKKSVVQSESQAKSSKSKYVEKEASSESEESGSGGEEESGSGSGEESDGGSEEEEPVKNAKRIRTSTSTSSEPIPATATSKKIDKIVIPSKPLNTLLKSAEKKNYDFRVTITNGQNFLRFMLPVANAVNEMRFNLAMTPEFTGLRLEAHDTCATLANISKFDCDIDPGVTSSGTPLTREDVNAITFCVATKTFMQTMNCSVLKEAVLSITRYTDKNTDALTFESSSNEDDVKAVYSCTLLDQASQEPLQFSINLNFHVTVELKTLKELSQNAKKCGAASIRFEVFQRLDPIDDNIVHSKMSIGFKSGSTSGSHGFYHSARKAIRNGVVEWTSIPGSSKSQEGMTQKCNNSYDISKLRTFLSHMDCEWALIHLPDDNTEQPLVIECDLGGPNTKHTIIISPNLAEAE